jgi:hypothetical protein
VKEKVVKPKAEKKEKVKSTSTAGATVEDNKV